MTTVELRIRNGDESRSVTGEGAGYGAAKEAAESQVPEGWQRVLYFQR